MQTGSSACRRARAGYRSARRFKRGLLHTSREEILLERSEWTLSSQTGEKAQLARWNGDGVDLTSKDHNIAAFVTGPSADSERKCLFSAHFSLKPHRQLFCLFLFDLSPSRWCPSVCALNLVWTHIELVQRFHLKNRKKENRKGRRLKASPSCPLQSPRVFHICAFHGVRKQWGTCRPSVVGC